MNGSATNLTVKQEPNQRPNQQQNQPSHHQRYFEEDENEQCRACHEETLVIDWKQGDKVCTNCGVVAESHLRDTRPEWKDFREAEDLVKGRPSGARSGMVAVDEAKYLGGLQPTLLSKHAFGGETSVPYSNSDNNNGYGMARIRRRLKTTNKRLDYMMEKLHTKSLQDARLDRTIRLTKQRSHKVKLEEASTQDKFHDSIRPELEQIILKEEQEARRIQDMLYSEKWSLDRAILLFGKAHEQRAISDEEREDLEDKLNKKLRKASQELYQAYSMTTQVTRDLHLPDSVQAEVVHRLVRFVTQKDGFKIAGIASRLNQESVSASSSRNISQDRAAALLQLRKYNLEKQIAGLGAALIFCTARSMGWTRSVAEICKLFCQHATVVDTEQVKNTLTHGKSNTFLKTKHVSRAMKEIQTLFPEYAKRPNPNPSANAGTMMSDATTATTTGGTVIATDSVSRSPTDIDSLAHFAEHNLRKLQLPPAAEAASKALLFRLRTDQLQLGCYTGIKLSTLSAGAAYMVSQAGSVMQRLAQQHKDSLGDRSFLPAKPAGKHHTSSRSKTSMTTTSARVTLKKRRNRQNLHTLSSKKRARTTTAAIAMAHLQEQEFQHTAVDKEKDLDTASHDNGSSNESVLSDSDAAALPIGEKALFGDDDDDDSSREDPASVDTTAKVAETKAALRNQEESDTDGEEPFDVFTHPAVICDPSQGNEYELRRMWDAWAEQTTWARTWADLEHSCGVSSKVIRKFYRNDLHHQNNELLKWLSETVDSKGNPTEYEGADLEVVAAAARDTLKATPMAPLLLSRISTAVPLMSKQ